MPAKKIILLLFVCILSISTAFSATVPGVWRQTSAEFSLIKTPAKDLKTEGTVFGELLKHTDRTLWSFIEDDRNIWTIAITYKVANQNETITQIGFYRTLDPAMLHELEVDGLQGKKVEMNIVYQSNSPLTIMFIINGGLVKAPALVVQSSSGMKNIVK